MCACVCFVLLLLLHADHTRQVCGEILCIVCVTNAFQYLTHSLSQSLTHRYYGCGTPLPAGISGLRVLDLGSGTGRDCYVAAQLVGEQGFVTGECLECVCVLCVCGSVCVLCGCVLCCECVCMLATADLHKPHATLSADNNLLFVNHILSPRVHTAAGIDMIPEQLEIANRHLESYSRDVLKYSKPNMKFIQVSTSHR